MFYLSDDAMAAASWAHNLSTDKLTIRYNSGTSASALNPRDRRYIKALSVDWLPGMTEYQRVKRTVIALTILITCRHCRQPKRHSRCWKPHDDETVLPTPQRARTRKNTPKVIPQTPNDSEVTSTPS
jgi:hypothetical protein